MNRLKIELTFLKQYSFKMLMAKKHFFLFLTLVFLSKDFKAQDLNLGLNIASSAAKVLLPYIQKEASWAMKQQPITVTASTSIRSSGGKHDFFSEGDYWWPNPVSTDSPYLQKDGMTNPDNFTDHRKAMVRFSRVMGSLASAYLTSKNEQYAAQAFKHARAWFIDTATLMNPHLLYAQAIKGRFTGRGIGIIDMIQMMEVSQALIVLEKSKSAKPNDYIAYRGWFERYLNWVTQHKYGIDEMNALNNHGTCWTMQVAGFARFTQNDSLLNICRQRYKNLHLPGQMAVDGGFPKELARTKPYGYSLFNLDAMATLCQMLSDKQNNVWDFSLADNRSIQKGISFLYPFVADKNKWTFKQDVMYWDNWPVAHPFLIFGAIALKDQDLFNTWKSLDHAPTEEEVIRNLPIRNPLIWFKE
jgi:hypothetical protein